MLELQECPAPLQQVSDKPHALFSRTQVQWMHSQPRKLSALQLGTGHVVALIHQTMELDQTFHCHYTWGCVRGYLSAGRRLFSFFCFTWGHVVRMQKSLVHGLHALPLMFTSTMPVFVSTNISPGVFLPAAAGRRCGGFCRACNKWGGFETAKSVGIVPGFSVQQSDTASYVVSTFLWQLATNNAKIYIKQQH